MAAALKSLDLSYTDQYVKTVEIAAPFDDAAYTNWADNGPGAGDFIGMYVVTFYNTDSYYPNNNWGVFNQSKLTNVVCQKQANGNVTFFGTKT